MARNSPGKKRRKGKKRGPLPALAACLAGALLCWGGLSTVDRRIRAVTINQSPPLWEIQEDLDQVKEDHQLCQEVPISITR